jgi:hypothetical protein
VGFAGGLTGKNGQVIDVKIVDSYVLEVVVDYTFDIMLVAAHAPHERQHTVR